MELFTTSHSSCPFGTVIEGLMRRMVSPITGLDKTVGFSLHDRGTAGIFVTIAQLTAVHRLVGRKKPLSYHLGGYGLRREEAMIRLLGETTERYSHMTCLLTGELPQRFESANELRAVGVEMMGFEGWNFFHDEIYSTPKIVFKPFDPDAPMTWLETWSLTENRPVWVPAQLLVLGYQRMTEQNEPWLSPAMTTGTAAHTIPERALNSAITELIQMDGAMGFWYGGGTAPEIELDERLATLMEILEDVKGVAYEACFHYVEAPGFDVHNVACILRSRQADLPVTGVGIACEMSLEEACYKSFLEASAIPHLAQIGFLRAPDILRREEMIDPSSISDLDSNVLYYALPEHLPLIDRRFSRIERVRASELPRYPSRSDRDLTKHLLDRFRENGLRLYYLEISTPDVRDLGFRVLRTYSPDLLSLCLPSFPQAGHPRFKSFGGFHVSDPHPFP